MDTQFDFAAVITTLTLIAGLLKTAVTMGGFGALGSAIVNALKTLGWVKDGQAPEALSIVNAVAFVAVLMVVFFAGFKLEQFDEISGLAATAITAVVTVAVALISLFGGSKAWHFILKGMPVIGKSFKKELADAQAKTAPVVKTV